jgi:hypothetical protein
LGMGFHGFGLHHWKQELLPVPSEDCPAYNQDS